MSDDLLDSLASLPRFENYDAEQRYHDFRKVFRGKEGQRVLRYILERGGVFHDPPLASPIDPLMDAIRRGGRRLALEIFSFYNNEPPSRPTTATRTKATQKS